MAFDVVHRPFDATALDPVRERYVPLRSDVFVASSAKIPSSEMMLARVR
jgi:hypothetical protein